MADSRHSLQRSLSKEDIAEPVLPDKKVLDISRSRIVTQLPSTGHKLDKTIAHIEHDLVPGFSRSSASPNYYGFVTGGATPAAKFADHVVVDVDQNVQVHLPDETIATDVESAALRMLCQLVKLDPKDWPHRTFTTGATASNTAGLACGRQFILSQNVAELGVAEALQAAGLNGIQILTTVPHSSLKKAASVVGIGRTSIVEIGRKDAPHRFDMDLLERYLQQPTYAHIVAISCGEVNTGFFATTQEDMLHIRRLCDRYYAWLHVDAAFGAMARMLPDTAEYEFVCAGVAGLELADSITGDAHKLINVVGLIPLITHKIRLISPAIRLWLLLFKTS